MLHVLLEHSDDENDQGVGVIFDGADATGCCVTDIDGLCRLLKWEGRTQGMVRIKDGQVHIFMHDPTEAETAAWSEGRPAG